MKREEKIIMAYGISGWFLIVHFTAAILNNLVGQFASGLVLLLRNSLDESLIRNTILSVTVFGIPSLIMVILGIVFLSFYRRRLKNILSQISELDVITNRAHVAEIKSSVFTIVGMIILVMAINSVISISVIRYQSLVMLFTSKRYFLESLLYVAPQYLMSGIEGVIGLSLLLSFSKKTKNIISETMSIVE